MSKTFTDMPGYPGDGDNGIVLHHGEPVKWTRNATVWSISMIVIAAIAAVAAVVVVMNID